jgi:CTP synthase
MQLAVVEYARNVLKWQDASSTEVNPKTAYPVIDILDEQKQKIKNKEYGNTMRLGNYTAELEKGSIALRSYGTSSIVERHRHRYEVYPNIMPDLRDAGMILSGLSPDGTLTEIVELSQKTHPFFLGCQFHPEFLARPEHPHPLFSAFVSASIKRSKLSK